MIDKRHVESLLHLHGMSPTSPEEEIRSVLLSAQYDSKEIDTAITVLRQNTSDNTSRLEGLHKIYRTDQGLKPNEVSELLGIDINVSALEIKNHRARGMTGGEYFIVLSLALVLAFGGLLYAMYEHETGPFHPTVTAFRL
jgi:hypothetical protein